MSVKWTPARKAKFKKTMKAKRAGKSDPNVRHAIVFLKRMQRGMEGSPTKSELYGLLALEALQGEL